MDTDVSIAQGVNVRFAQYTPHDKEIISVSSVNIQTTFTDYPINGSSLAFPGSNELLTALIVAALIIYVTGIIAVWRKLSPALR